MSILMIIPIALVVIIITGVLFRKGASGIKIMLLGINITLLGIVLNSTGIGVLIAFLGIAFSLIGFFKDND